MTAQRDPRDLSQYCILKWGQFYVYFALIFLAGALLGAGVGISVGMGFR